MTDFVHGMNNPSPVVRIVILDYYDGAFAGVMELDGGTAFRFDCTDEAHNPDGCDERRYALRPLPAGSFERLVATLSEHFEPHWPARVPVWKFPSDEVRSEVDHRVDAILEQAGEPRWQIATTDTVEFRSVVAEPLRMTARVV